MVSQGDTFKVNCFGICINILKSGLTFLKYGFCIRTLMYYAGGGKSYDTTYKTKYAGSKVNECWGIERVSDTNNRSDATRLR